MRRFTSMFKRDNFSSSSSSTSSDIHISTPAWKSWIGPKRKPPPPPLPPDVDEDSQSEQEEPEDYQQNIRIHIQSKLVVNPQPNSPFVYHPDQPIFPRSSNNTNILSRQSSIHVSMLNAHLLARLDSAVPAELSGFASKSMTPSITHPILPFSDIPRPKDASRISSASLGIQRWITRPCFEDRFAVYLPTDSGVHCRPVTSSMAIAALEYPEYLDAMVDPDFDQPPHTNSLDHHSADSSHTVPPIQSHDSNLTSVTPMNRRNSSTPVPSPLRIQHGPPLTTKKDIPSVISSAPKSTVKRVVRFVEDDEDDGIPLHMVRMKKKREEKAKFLLQEQLKRTKDEEEEQRRQDQEALERERRRLAKEKEKKEMDKVLYAETIAAARMRREGNRAGTFFSSNTSNTLATSPSYTSIRNSERNKPPTNSRKFSSSKPPFDSPPTSSMPRIDNSDSTSSPGSSRPPSIGHSPVSPNSHHSRPPSTYSTHTSSSEELRQQRGNRRHSLTVAAVASLSSGPSSYHRPPMVLSYPTWSNSSQTLPHPDFVHDMPLLPPTAPFMKDSSYNRSRGPSSTSSSRHHSSTAVPSSRSKPEKRPTNERRSSGDSTTLSLHSTQHRQRPVPTSSRSQPTLSRGRPVLSSSSQYLQPPGPWPALPSQNGMMPMPMGYSPMNAYPVLLYPTVPMPAMQSVQLGSGGVGGRIGENNNGWREPLIS